MNYSSLLQKTLIFAIAPFLVIAYPLSMKAQADAQERSPLEIEYGRLVKLNRAKNLARQAAERANGGLTEYRPEPAMHGPAQRTEYEELAEGVWQFTFKGRRPRANEYTIESVVVVDSNTGDITVEYNGPIRE